MPTFDWKKIKRSLFKGGSYITSTQNVIGSVIATCLSATIIAFTPIGKQLIEVVVGGGVKIQVDGPQVSVQPRPVALQRIQGPQAGPNVAFVTTAQPPAVTITRLPPKAVVSIGEVRFPSDITEAYVFYQEKADQTSNGCINAPRAVPLFPPNQLAVRINEFSEYGRAHPDVDVVITAKSESRSWGAPEEIVVPGYRLVAGAYYHCDNWTRTGYRLTPAG